MPQKKMGRPTDNPKDDRITVRLDKASQSILTKYCEQENIDKAESIRRGIAKLEGSIQK